MRHVSAGCCLVFLPLFLMLTACGGGGGGPDTIVVAVTGPLDGFVGKVGNVDTTGSELFVGEYLTNPTRSVLGFELGAVPAGATVIEATLRVELFDVRGVPFTDLGALVLDHVDLGATIDASDYGSTALASAFATLATTPVQEVKTADVTAQVVSALALGAPRADFRIRFTLESDGNTGDEDLIGFPQFGNGNNPATLTIRYEK